MILLDTNTFLWLIIDSDRLSSKAKKVFLNKNNKVYLSTVSFWEIVIKYKLGKLPLPEIPSIYIPRKRIMHGIDSIPLEDVDIMQLENLPQIHKDPFDRMLVCQAISRNLTILTPDKLINKYLVKTEW